jgi:hypothetical protein
MSIDYIIYTLHAHNSTSLNVRSLPSKVHKTSKPAKSMENCKINLSNKELIRHAERSSKPIAQPSLCSLHFLFSFCFIHSVPNPNPNSHSIPPRHPLLPRITRPSHMRMRVHSHELGFADSRVVSSAGVARGSALVSKRMGFLLLLLVLLLRLRSQTKTLLLLLGVVAGLRCWAPLLLLRLLWPGSPVGVLVVLSRSKGLFLLWRRVFDRT